MTTRIEAAYRQRAKEFAAALRFWRGSRALNQTQLADKAGVSRGRIVCWENARVMPTIDRLWALADALDVRPEDLLRRDPRYAVLDLSHLDDEEARLGRPPKKRKSMEQMQQEQAKRAP